MPRQGQHDRFEQIYMAQLRTLLTSGGVPIAYEQDRAAIDTGLHLFMEGSGSDYLASQARVWFQAKGKRRETLSAAEFDAASWVTTSVEVEHLRFWYAAPEPVYLAVFIESKGVFIAEDARVIVHRMWPRGDFYRATDAQTTVTVRLDKAAILDEPRIVAMLAHRSMRIDGATFQGRPLGHRFDPLRSELAIDTRQLWDSIVARLMSEYRFRPTRPPVSVGPDMRVVKGRFYDTMVWQSSAFAEFGTGPDDDFRDDPAVESVQGAAIVVVDGTSHRSILAADERATLLRELSKSEVPVVLFFFGKDLSGTGGVWRRFFNDEVRPGRCSDVRMIGIEALTSLVLAATMVYLDLAPALAFRTVNYRF
jgi:hypothetical protein